VLWLDDLRCLHDNNKGSVEEIVFDDNTVYWEGMPKNESDEERYYTIRHWKPVSYQVFYIRTRDHVFPYSTSSHVSQSTSLKIEKLDHWKVHQVGMMKLQIERF
jgi:hypothetical protein